ncbi:O-antigen ligase family protein [Pontiella agarivorans]|uniref:O-antigen ligase family protein n=1 Tax=Pontiella agarivorans TaxID=3038953 RepID=A0ABU5MYW3_9BACT|nr:O-antigen ligase family protein [Pontiella agarivorans]MDZ8119378.1 O-antigen ligase family protein [Pontiella agarivorans]
MGLLCVLTFLATITTGQNVFDNAWLIFWYEAIFVSGFLIYRGSQGRFGNLFPVKSVGFWLLALWFMSITLSLMMSPYALMTEWFAVQRYLQTLFHLVFFLCVLIFFKRYKGSASPVFFSLALSVAVLALLFVDAWFAMPEPLTEESKEWFRRPPYNAHIRITGFLVAAAAAALQPVFCRKSNPAVSTCYYVVGLAVWGLMFWTGGRGAIISAYAACVAIALVLLIRKQPWKHYLIALGIFTIGGILISELFEVFYWNGIFQAAERTMAAGGDPYKMTTGRVTFCGWVVESLNLNHAWLFGLGSQGYCYMPNRTFAFQPHNLIFQFLAEWGIVGTVLFLCMIGYGCFMGFRQTVFQSMEKLSVPKLSALAVIVSLGVHSLVDGIFYHAQPSLHLAIAFAVWMATTTNKLSGRD